MSGRAVVQESVKVHQSSVVPLLPLFALRFELADAHALT